MKHFLVRLVLMGCAFYFVLPMIHGIEFHGNFFHAVMVGIFFAFMGWVIELIAIALSTMLTIGTLGLALIILIPAWLLGFWLLPAIVLKVVSDIMPSTLTINGWGPALWGGLVMFVIGIITGGDASRRSRKIRA